MSSTLALAMELIARPSVTPEDRGCQDLLGDRLAPLGFRLEEMRFGDVRNLWARLGDAAPLFVFAGHTDVVPTGPEDDWRYPPFTPTLDDGMLYGRGAADMKGSLAAMVTACERYLAGGHRPAGSIAFLVTSDEEGPARDGTLKVVETLQARGERMDWCLVGEPSSDRTVGDVVKNGRRGSLNGRLRVKGVQGHVAYPALADNPVHRALPALDELARREWDTGDDFFPPTSFQISNLTAGTGAENVIPGTLDVTFNFRYSPALSREALEAEMDAILRRHGLDFSVEWSHSGTPFITRGGPLIEAIGTAVRDVTGRDTELSTAGGTSDGRFIAPTGTQVAELGPVNATIHKVDECVRADDLDGLSAMYERVLERLLGTAG